MSDPPPPKPPLGHTLSHPTQGLQAPQEEGSRTSTSLGRHVPPPARQPSSPPLPRPEPVSRLSPWREPGPPREARDTPPLPRASMGKGKGKGHSRSISIGGVTFTRSGSARERVVQGDPSADDRAMPPPAPLPSVLKGGKGHRRVFSHGQINPEQTAIPGHMKTNNRDGSKTDFILPPGHEERERERKKSSSLSMNRMGRGGDKGGSLPGHAALAKHKRHHSRSDSLGQTLSMFRSGHSRQASRTDSIYTLRQTPTNYKQRIFWWQRDKGKDREEEPAARKHREITPNHHVPTGAKASDHPNSIYLNNRIRTTKYTFLSFIPRNLFEQFHRFANLYFLFIVLLNWVPAINAFGKEISMIPVILVLIVTAVKDLFEDRRRYASDKKVNNSFCRVYSTAESQFVKVWWKDLKVGDIVHLSNNEQIPADILMLHSSDPNGLCYIDTQNLDGETNLKQREIPRGLKLAENGTFNPLELRAKLECDAPTTKIYRFHGSLVQPWGERIPVGKDNLLLRECLLKNTGYIEGLVVYAGHESKAMLNNGGPRYKRSKLERQINMEVVWCVLILVTLCLLGAAGSGLWFNSFTALAPFHADFLDFSELNPLWSGFLAFWTFIIILQIIIPLSLYVTIELTKLSQVYLIHNDPLMYDEVHDKRVECRALNITEELGQVQYMFCDKTGTLTENKMVFKRCTIGGQDFGHNSFSVKDSSRAIIPVNPRLEAQVQQMEYSLVVEDHHLPPLATQATEFFLLLAVCNTVIVASHPHRDTMNASGEVCETPDTEAEARPSRNAANITTLTAISASPPTPSRSSTTPSPPPSIVSTVSSTAALTRTTQDHTDSSSTPATKHTASRRPRFLDFRPLSPIHSSAETTPAESPGARHKSLQLSTLMNPLKGLSTSSLHKSSRSLVCSPGAVPGVDNRPIYEAESPDELALVDAAHVYNCRLVNRTPTTVTVSLPGEGTVNFQVLHVLPFDSTRKRMSVLLRNPNSGERKLFCKGADSAMVPRLCRPQSLEEEGLLEQTQQHLTDYSNVGLRVLMAAVRTLSEEEYQDWATQHLSAENALEKRDKLLMDSFNRIENKMRLVGATGIEDRLQDGVPEAIARLRQAGIVVWVLTGDKQETAINIAHSCRLFSADMEVIKLNARSRDAAEGALSLYLDQCQHSSLPRERRALVVDGKTLIYVLDKRANIQHLFLDLTKQCSAVLACRATPLQKSYLVRLVKEQLGMHTLAIGDGANDVSMIQTADIGVGISGQEGMQAVMASDFAISRFKYIDRLLLVHGHWCYDRLARMVLHFFYKNACFVFVCFWFQLYCGFSGQVMIDQMYLMLFNLLFTSLPPYALGVFDRDAPADLLASQPHLYSVGRLSTAYKPYSFWINMLDAIFQSLAVFFISLGAFSGSDMGLWEFGTLLCSQSILVMLIQCGVETKSWTVVHWASILISVGLYLAFGLIYNAVCSQCGGLTNPYLVMQHGLADPSQWAVLLITGVVSNIPRVFCRAVVNSLHPTDVARAVIHRRRERRAGRQGARYARSSSQVSEFGGTTVSIVESSSRLELGGEDTEMSNITSSNI